MIIINYHQQKKGEGGNTNINITGQTINLTGQAINQLQLFDMTNTHNAKLQFGKPIHLDIDKSKGIFI